MDALFFFKHSQADDLEIRFALRGIARHAPWIRKVWIFGDRPRFLSGDTSQIEHIPHESLAWIGRYRVPVRNTFLMFHLTSLLPELSEEFLFFNDDFILLKDWEEQDARRIRFIEDLSKVPSRGRGVWKDALWRTHDTLRRLDFGTLNFENHVPTYFRKRWVMDAMRDFRDFVSEDRFFGLLAETAILNHARKRHELSLVHLATEGSRAGFYGKPPTPETLRRETEQKQFLSFDDHAFGESIRQFLRDRFPTPCKFEQTEPPPNPLETFELIA